MIKRVSKHAWKRLEERQGAKHKTKVVNKLQKWSIGLPDNADYCRKGFKYVVRDGVLITIYYIGRGPIKQWAGDERIVVIPVEAG